jgi:LMBR1 domain-containing protein 1
MALMSFIGWFLFAIFAGLGIPGIPIDMVRGFANRPQRLDRGQIAALELSIQVKSCARNMSCVSVSMQL